MQKKKKDRQSGKQAVFIFMSYIFLIKTYLYKYAYLKNVIYSIQKYTF